MSIDTSLPVRTTTGESVEILKTDGKGNYPIIALVSTEDGDELAMSFDAEGTSYSGEYTLENFEDSAVKVPEGILRVHTRKKGSGVVLKVRNDEKRSLYVRPDNGEKPFWALNKNVSAAA